MGQWDYGCKLRSSLRAMLLIMGTWDTPLSIS